jgi:hypothetical protein
MWTLNQTIFARVPTLTFTHVLPIFVDFVSLPAMRVAAEWALGGRQFGLHFYAMYLAPPKSVTSPAITAILYLFLQHPVAGQSFLHENAWDQQLAKQG